MANWNHTTSEAAPGLGVLIRHWRYIRDVSLNELARRIGADHSTLSRIESGSRRPSRDMAIRLADALELTGAHRVKFTSEAGYIERALTDAQASYIAGWNDRFTGRYVAGD